MRTPDEVRVVLGLLLRDRSYYDTMELLATFSPAAFQRTLERRLALVCENCNPPEGKYPIRVDDEAQCEVCHGRSLEQGAQAFVAACREAGVQRVNLVGGPPRGRRRVADLLARHLDLRLLDQPVTVPDDWLREAAEEADLTLLWGESFLDKRVVAQFKALDSSRVVHISHPGPGGMLAAAARAVGHAPDQTLEDHR